MTTAEKIILVSDGMKELLLEKNRRYGDSALNPRNIFSKTSSDEQIRVRLDDKLSRVMNSDTLRKNDVSDIIGYLVLLAIANGWTDFTDLID